MTELMMAYQVCMTLLVLSIGMVLYSIGRLVYVLAGDRRWHLLYVL